MPRKKPNGYITSGVNFEPEVLTYLAELGEKEDRTRSYLVNKIVREYADRHKRDILPGFEDLAQSA